MYDLNRIKTDFVEACEMAGVEVEDSNIITLNSRLTRTLGRVFSNYQGKDLVPTKVEFSKSFIETSTDECIHQTILHEAAHYIAVKRSKVDHGHDAYFKQICAEIGCYEDKTQSHVDRLVGAPSPYKYLVFCPNCGHMASRTRKCKLITHIENYSCGKCGSKLYYKEV